METYRASKTEAILVENEIASVFLKENHRSKTARAEGIVSVGLALDGELLAVAQFCNPRTSVMAQTYSVELLRMAFKGDTRIHGGASKLIQFFISTYKPADFFTYQDTTGQLTDVYKHAGMTLVKDGLKTTKEYLVAPGKTLETAKREEILSIPYAVKYGPDAILGLKLGEVIDPETGKRKSNKRLFVEELGWQIEKTTGDHIYEWIDPNRTYYTYKITATDSEKYYYGVSHVKKANASIEDCLNDGYWGSGGVKFQNWKRVHNDFLVKDVISLHTKRMKAFEHEEKLVILTDPLSLNSAPDGVRNRKPALIPQVVTAEECSTHGITAFVNSRCSKCAVSERTFLRECPIHGISKHQGRTCYSCMFESMSSFQNCPKHGKASFIGDQCRNCISEKSFTEKECSIHGLTPHHGTQCSKCAVAKRTDLRECSVHGLVKFQGESCYQCVTNDRHSIKECNTHGMTLHSGDICVKCHAASRYSLMDCTVHGSTKHNGTSCVKCELAKNFKIRECSIHGETKHNGSHCMKCQAQKAKKANGAFGGISDDDLRKKLRGRDTKSIAEEFGVARSTVNLAKRRLLT